MKKTSYIILTLLILFTINSFSQINFKIAEYPFPTLPSYSKKQVMEAFVQLKDNENYDYHYVNSGCNYKAHFVNLLLSKVYNIKTFKIWNFSKNQIYYSFGQQLKLKDPNGLTKNDSLYWGFHVAAAVLIKNNNKIDTMVIDLGFDDNRIIDYKEWLNYQNQKKSYYIFTAADYNGYETIIPGYDTKDNEFKKILTNNAPSQIFSGAFFDDKYSIDSTSIMAKALALDILISKYYKETLSKEIENDPMILQATQMIPQKIAQQPQRRPTLKSEGLTDTQIDRIFENEIKDLYKMIKERRYVYTQKLSDYSNVESKLPDNYKVQLPTLTIKIQLYLKSLRS